MMNNAVLWIRCCLSTTVVLTTILTVLSFSQEKEYHLGEIVVTAERVHDEPYSVDELSQKELQSRNARSLAEAL